MADLESILTQGLQQQGLSIARPEREQLLHFVNLLSKWNKTYNLTSIRRPEDMVTLHLLDSLVMLPYFQSDKSIKNVLDVGTGGGIPGIPLAICLPEIQFVLLDARVKKIRFIQTVIAQLGLKNVAAVHARVEEFQIQEREFFDRVISRAFASLADMLMLCRHLCHKNGKFLAMKGQIPEEEIAQLPEGFRIDQINKLEVAGLNAQRHLIQVIFSK